MPDLSLPDLHLPDLSGLAGRAGRGARRGFRHLLRRLAAPRPQTGGPDPGPAVIADGEHAVAITEAWISDAAALTPGRGPGAEDSAAGAAFAREASHEGTNLLDRPVTVVPAASPRGALAAALGLAEAGRRATVFLTGSELESARDLLARAVQRRAPLVLHLRCGTASAHGPVHLAAQAGAPVLLAANVQEALDLTLVARRLAEEALLPVVVAQDGETATSLQEVHLPTPTTVRHFLGDPSETVHPATPAQELLFGRHRRRLFAAHDPERPRASGALRDAAVEERSSSARSLYLDAGLGELLDRACERLTSLTGRPLARVTGHRVEKADRLLVAMGATVEVAEGVAERLREEGRRLGVVGLRGLLPLPTESLGEMLRDRREVLVVERAVPETASGPGPLTVALRGALEASSVDPPPALLTTVLGVDGVRGRDLATLGRLSDEDLQSHRSPIWLGLDFAPDLSAEPKRQAVRDALRRDYPEVASHGLTADSSDVDLRPPGTVTVAIPPSRETGHLADELASVLHRALGGHLRGRRLPSEDLLTWSSEPLRDPGNQVPVEVRLTSLSEIRRGSPWTGLAGDGALLLPVPAGPGEEEVAKSLGSRVSSEVRLYTVAVPADDDPSLIPERQLGALLGVLEQSERLSVSHRKLLDARKTLLREEGVEESERQRRLGAFTAGLDGARELTFPASTERLGGEGSQREARFGTGASEAVADAVPESVRRLSGDGGWEIDRLPRFWDQVGSLARRGETDRLLPDPPLALGALPPRSAAFRSFAAGRVILPDFDPAACTGCGACWSACPHGALEPRVVGIEALIDTGMARASAAGLSVDVLRGVRSRLTGALAKELARTDGSPAGPLLDRAFEAATAKMPLSEERKAAIGEAFRAVRGELATLPLARTAPFFDEPETTEKGTGEIFTLAVDPDACRACGLCLAECEPEALTAQPDGPERSRLTRGVLDLVTQLPAPSRETVERARSHPEIGPLAGTLLDPAARRVMGGGEGAEPGSGTALAVRRALGAAVWHLAPRRRELIERLDDLRRRLATAVHDELAGALPERDLDALARGLESVELPDADLGEITERVESAFDSPRVDVVRLRRLVGVARQVADLARHVGGGGGGRGRAPLGVVLGPGAEPLAAFPWNPFAVPVTVEPSGETAEVARGLAAGRLQEALEQARLLRRAERELDSPQEAAQSAEISLRLEDLTDEERRACPPVWVVTEERELTAKGLAGLLDLLGTDLPVRLLVLTSEDSRRSPRLDAGLLALTEWQRGAGRGDSARCTVGQTSLAVPDHLERAVQTATEADGPALLRVPTPSPSRQSFAPEETLERSRESLAAGLTPLYLSCSVEAEPEGPTPALDLSGNPDLEELFEDLPAGHRATWSLLRRLSVETIPTSGPEAETGKVEVGAEGDQGGDADQRHRQELAAMQADYEARLAAQRAEIQAATRLETARRVRARLLELAMRARLPAADPGNGSESETGEGTSEVTG